MYGITEVQTMSIPCNVSSRVHKSEPTKSRTANENVARRSCSSCSCGRFSLGSDRIQVGQKVVTDLFLKEKQERARYNLIIFMAKLVGNKIYEGST